MKCSQLSAPHSTRFSLHANMNKTRELDVATHIASAIVSSDQGIATISLAVGLVHSGPKKFGSTFVVEFPSPTQCSFQGHLLIVVSLNKLMNVRDGVVQIVRSDLVTTRKNAIHLCREGIWPWSCVNGQSRHFKDLDILLLGSCGQPAMQRPRHPHLRLCIKPIGS